MPSAKPLTGTCIAITRPAGQGATFARRARTLGGRAFTLPGSSLRGIDDDATRARLAAALASDVAIFTSPAAVRFARALQPLATRAAVLAPGTGTRAALARAGLPAAITPNAENSEGLLALPLLAAVRGKRIGIIGAAGGRGMLQRELAACGATLIEAHVYARHAPHLTRRHFEALLRARRTALYVPLSSSEALANLLAVLPDPARAALLAGSAVASSARIAAAARDAGFARVVQAASAHVGDCIDCIVADRAKRRT